MISATADVVQRKAGNLTTGDSSFETVIGLTAVIVAVTEETPRVLVARRMHHDLATPAQQGRSAAPEESRI